MQEITATVTSKGQVTIPIAVRKQLDIKTGDKLAFVIGDEGRIEVRPVRYATIESLRGAAGSLPKPLSWEEMRAIAREDREAARAPRQ